MGNVPLKIKQMLWISEAEGKTPLHELLPFDCTLIEKANMKKKNVRMGYLNNLKIVHFEMDLI